MALRFNPGTRVSTPEGEGIVHHMNMVAPAYKEIDYVVCLVNGEELEFPPEKLKILDEEPAPHTDRQPKKAKTVRLNVQFQNADGSLLPKSEFLSLMGTEYDRLREEMFGGNYEDIEKHVLAAFAKHKGARLNLKFLESALIQGIQAEQGGNISPEDWSRATKRFSEYMKRATGEKGTALYGMKKGSGNGHWLWSDYQER
jgi:hypothetical protein